MRNNLLYTFYLCLFFIANANAQTTLIHFESSWKYYDEGNEPPVLSSQKWYKSNYNDNGWSSGEAQLGYGDNDEETELDEDAETIYMRKDFSVSNASNYPSLEIQLLYDDGAVVYLNGSEVKRINMSSGTVDYQDYSITEDGDNSITTFSIQNLLVNGDNVIAVEMHQRDEFSSDLSFDLELTANSGGSSSVGTEEIIRGPYLQNNTSESIVIKWRTEDPASSILHYGNSPNNLNFSVSDYANKRNHELKITNLSPNTTYYYSIPNGYSTNVDLDNDLFFKTHPAIGEPETLRAWILGDCGTGNEDQEDVRDAFYDYNGSEELDMILFLGDNAYTDGEDDEYQDALFEDKYEEKLKNTTAWSCLGNHDADSADSDDQSGVYYDIFTFPRQGEAGGIASGTEAYYSFDYGNVHFIVLDSEESDTDDDAPMYEWAENDIQNTLADWIIAFWHHPPYSKGSHDSDSEGGLRAMRENFLPMLEENGIDLVLSGHSHSYERSYLINGHYNKSHDFEEDDHIVGSRGDGDGQEDGDGAYRKDVTGSAAGDGAVYVVTGSAGKKASADLDHPVMYYSASKLGSCLLEVEGDDLQLKFIRENGDVDDYFTLRKDLGSSSGNGGGSGGGGTPDCDDIVIMAQDGGVFIDGLDGAPLTAIEIRDNSNWNSVFSCFGNCGGPTKFVPVPDGRYYVVVKYFTASSGWICLHSETVEISGSPGNTSCNISLDVSGDDIEIDGLNTSHRIIKAFNSDWEEVFECTDNNCGNSPEISNLDDDEYYVRVLGYSENWIPICEHTEYVTIGSGSNAQSNGHTDHFFLQGSKINKITQLDWVTNSDFKNNYFDLERSTNGFDFEVIDQRQSESETEEYRYYQGQDLAPKAGVNFYRAKQIYHDGNYRYSNTLMINYDQEMNANILYPNPAAEETFLHLGNYIGEKALITVNNSLGKIVMNQEIEAVPEAPVLLNLSSLTAGWYSVSVTIGNGKMMHFNLVKVEER